MDNNIVWYVLVRDIINYGQPNRSMKPEKNLKTFFIYFLLIVSVLNQGLVQTIENKILCFIK